MTITHITEEAKAVLERQLHALTPETLHKLMNPYCGHCILERGKQVIEQINSGTWGPQRFTVRDHA